MNINEFKCPSCDGKGSYYIDNYIAGRQRILCPDCKGRGYLEDDSPPDCYITVKVVEVCDCEWLWSCAARWRYRKDKTKPLNNKNKIERI